MDKARINLGSLRFAVSLIVCAGMIGIADAQKKSQAETGLVGVKLYDSVYKLLTLFGPPDDILPMGASSSTGPAAPANPMGGVPGVGIPPAVSGRPTGAGGGPRRAGAPRSGGGGGAAGSGFVDPSALPPDNPGLGDFFFGQRNPSGVGPGQFDANSPGGYRPPGVPPGVSIPTGAAPPRGGVGPGVPSVGGGFNAAPAVNLPPGTRQYYVRWIYKRGGAKYAFLADRHDRIIQIEAIGLENKKVRTRKGLGFGATFTKVIKVYGRPDSYDINGNQLIMRYQIRNKIVFRLNRLEQDGQYLITGILVAAGKS